MTDTEFDLGINNAVQICMNIKENDRVFIITDQETLRIGETLSRESAKTGAQTRIVKLEQYSERPLTSVPEILIQDMVDFKPTVTFLQRTAKREK